LSVVLVEHAAEPVSPVHTAPIPADDGWIGRWIRRFQPESSVGTVDVVMVHVDPKRVLQVAAPTDQEPVQALGPDCPDPALGVSVALGACTGVISTSAHSDPNPSSNARVKLVSRSRSRNRGRGPSAGIGRLRACWVTQAPSGLVVTPATWTRRGAGSSP
jgi:hypothetical protein